MWRFKWPTSALTKYSIHATNSYGMQSAEPAMTNGITILDPNADPDLDGHPTHEELTAQSDPMNSFSIPGDSVVRLSKGFNLVGYPAEVLFYQSYQEVLEAMGGPGVIDRVFLHDGATGKYRETGYDGNGTICIQGADGPLPRGRGLGGMIVYAKVDHTATLSSRYCNTWQVRPGTNLTGTGCVEPAGLTAFDLLPDLSPESVQSSIQRYDAVAGKFATANDRGDDQPLGENFAIQPGEGYFVHVQDGGMACDNDTSNGCICNATSDCGSGYYCAKYMGQCEQSGVCTPLVGQCPTTYAPVCGCDGQTYDNDCVAIVDGPGVDHQGQCIP